MSNARGAPDDFAVIALYGVGQAGKLVDGAVARSGTAYAIVGVAPDARAYDQAIAATRHLSDHAPLLRADIEPRVAPPSIWAAISDGKSVTLPGSASSIQVPDLMVIKAASAVTGAAVKRRLQIATGTPPGANPVPRGSRLLSANRTWARSLTMDQCISTSVRPLFRSILLP